MAFVVVELVRVAFVATNVVANCVVVVAFVEVELSAVKFERVVEPLT